MHLRRQHGNRRRPALTGWARIETGQNLQLGTVLGKPPGPHGLGED